MVNGKLIKYDMMSGCHVLFFRALDAFLGLTLYLTVENRVRYIPDHQRERCAAFKKHYLWTRYGHGKIDLNGNLD